jgi:plasmid stability protein
MAHLTIEMPEELVRTLKVIAAAQHKSVQQLAVEQLSSLLEGSVGHGAGYPGAVLQAMQEPPHLTGVAVDELDAAISAGRLAVLARDLFSD